jgi:hypothetical protein
MAEFSFLANDPTGQDSYTALEQRRKIAMAMMGQKRAYPKNIGEGLASIGQDIGDIGMMKMLERQTNAQQAQRAAAAAAAETGGGVAPPPVSAPARTSAAAATTDVATAAPTATDAAPVVSPDDVNVGDAGVTPAEMEAARASLAADALQARAATDAPENNPYTGTKSVAEAAPWLADQSSAQALMTGRGGGTVGVPSPNQVARAQGGVGGPAVAAAGYRAAPAYLQPALDRLIQDPERRAYLGQLAGKEAQGPNEVSPTGASGPFQFTRGTGKEYGLLPGGQDMRQNIDASILAANKLTDFNAKVLTDRLGRPPTPGELALAHQQGAVTAANMISGTGNASPQNLAVNAVSPGASPNAAAQKIMAYYGMPGGSPRDAVAAQLVANQQPLTAADATSEARFKDVVGMSGGDTGAYSYPATASRGGDVMSDAPPLGITGGPSSKVGQSVGDTVQQREGIYKTLMDRTPTAPEVPQPNPTQQGVFPPPTTTSLPPSAATTGSPPEARDNRPIVMPDIRPQPAAPVPVPGAQLAASTPPMPPESQMPPAIPPPGTPQRPVPEPAAEPRVQVPPQYANAPVRPPDPIEPPKSPRQLYNERAINATDDPYMQQVHQRIIGQEEKLRSDEYNRRVEKWKADMLLYQQEYGKQQDWLRGTPQRELELQKAEDERQARQRDEQINRLLGGVPQADYISMLKQGKADIAGIPAATESIKRARALVDKMYTGPLADIDTSLSKLMGAAGFPVDPKASGTEQFKTAMAGVMAQSRKAIVGPGSQSEAELALLQKSTAADAKLTPETIKATLDAAERLNLQTALAHQKLVRRFAGETDPDRQASVYTAYGVPNMADLVPQGAVDVLKRDAADPEAHREFDNTFHTPGLSREVLRYRR